MADKIETLEQELKTAEEEIQNHFKTGKLPKGDAYAVVDRIKKELKVARRVKSMDAKRVDPKLKRKISIMLPEDEYQALVEKAKAVDLNLSIYIRNLLNQ